MSSSEGKAGTAGPATVAADPAVVWDGDTLLQTVWTAKKKKYPKLLPLTESTVEEGMTLQDWFVEEPPERREMVGTAFCPILSKVCQRIGLTKTDARATTASVMAPVADALAQLGEKFEGAVATLGMTSEMDRVRRQLELDNASKPISADNRDRVDDQSRTLVETGDFSAVFCSSDGTPFCLTDDSLGADVAISKKMRTHWASLRRKAHSKEVPMYEPLVEFLKRVFPGETPVVETRTDGLSQAYALRGQLGDVTLSNDVVIEAKNLTAKLKDQRVLVVGKREHFSAGEARDGIKSTDTGYEIASRHLTQLFAEADGHLSERGHRVRLLVLTDGHVWWFAVHDVVSVLLPGDEEGWRNRFRVGKTPLSQIDEVVTMLVRLRAWVGKENIAHLGEHCGSDGICTRCEGDTKIHRPVKSHLEVEEIEAKVVEAGQRFKDRFTAALREPTTFDELVARQRAAEIHFPEDWHASMERRRTLIARASCC